jgi:hypothetical protein
VSAADPEPAQAEWRTRAAFRPVQPALRAILPWEVLLVDCRHVFSGGTRPVDGHCVRRPGVPLVLLRDRAGAAFLERFDVAPAGSRGKAARMHSTACGLAAAWLGAPPNPAPVLEDHVHVPAMAPASPGLGE